MKIVLLGYMGIGKSSVGVKLAKTLSYDHFDLDTEIENREHKSISELFRDKGEIFFRKKENEVLKALIRQNSKLVLSTGGGTPCYGDSMQFLNTHKEVITIYLKGSLELLTNRLFAEREHRPLIAHLDSENLLKDFIRKHLFERAYYYNQATITIDTDDRTVNETVELIVSQLF